MMIIIISLSHSISMFSLPNPIPEISHRLHFSGHLSVILCITYSVCLEHGIGSKLILTAKFRYSSDVKRLHWKQFHEVRS
jgi:hypothetical protein